MAFQPVPSLQSRQKRDKRTIYELAVTEAETHSIKKVFTERSKPKLPSRKADVQLVDPLFITGEAVTQFTDSKNQIYVQNITLKDADSGKVILQRFAPTALHTAEAMAKDARWGQHYFKAVSDKANCKKHSAATRQLKQQQKFPHFHFGAWYDLSMVNLVISSETLQKGNEEGKQAVADFCAWFKLFAVQYFEPLIQNKHSGLCDAFRQELIDRSNEHFPWAVDRVPGLDKHCHTLYSTISAFQGFSGKSHKDHKDADVSILVNFGQHAILELRHYNCQVVLQPLDIVVFLSNSIYHRTIQHPAHVAANSKVGD